MSLNGRFCFDLEISWTRTQAVCVDDPPLYIQTPGNDVEVVDAFTYLGMLDPNAGSSEPEISG